MKATRTGRKWIDCPACGYVEMPKGQLTLPLTEVVAYESGDRVNSEHTSDYMFRSTTNPSTFSVYLCPDCSYVVFEEDGFPEVYDEWQCGECDEIYYGSEADEDAAECCT